MTEEEVLSKIEQFKTAIVRMKDEIKSLKEENAALKGTNADYTSKVNEKLDEIESLLNED